MTYYPKEELHKRHEQQIHLHGAMLAASQNYSLANYDGHFFTQTQHNEPVENDL
jgi:hypothetical protein